MFTGNFFDFWSTVVTPTMVGFRFWSTVVTPTMVDFFLWLPVNGYHGSVQILSYRGNRFFRLPRLPRLPW